MASESALTREDADAQSVYADAVVALRTAGATEGEIQSFLDMLGAELDNRLANFAGDLEDNQVTAPDPNLASTFDSSTYSAPSIVNSPGLGKAGALGQVVIILSALNPTNISPDLVAKLDPVTGSFSGRIDNELAAAQTKDPTIKIHRGRFQAQGSDITVGVRGGSGTISYPWALLRVIGKREGRQMAAVVYKALTSDQQSARQGAYESLIQFANNCPLQGCNAFIGKTWPGQDVPIRIDLEITTGIAFNGISPQ